MTPEATMIFTGWIAWAIWGKLGLEVVAEDDLGGLVPGNEADGFDGGAAGELVGDPSSEEGMEIDHGGLAHAPAAFVLFWRRGTRLG